MWINVYKAFMVMPAVQEKPSYLESSKQYTIASSFDTRVTHVQFSGLEMTERLTN